MHLLTHQNSAGQRSWTHRLWWGGVLHRPDMWPNLHLNEPKTKQRAAVKARHKVLNIVHKTCLISGILCERSKRFVLNYYWSNKKFGFCGINHYITHETEWTKVIKKPSLIFTFTVILVLSVSASSMLWFCFLVHHMWIHHPGPRLLWRQSCMNR